MGGVSFEWRLRPELAEEVARVGGTRGLEARDAVEVYEAGYRGRSRKQLQTEINNLRSLMESAGGDTEKMNLINLQLNAARNVLGTLKQGQG